MPVVGFSRRLGNPTFTLDENVCRSDLPGQMGPMDNYIFPTIFYNERVFLINLYRSQYWGLDPPQEYCGTTRKNQGKPRENPWKIKGKPRKIKGKPRKINGKPSKIKGKPKKIEGKPRKSKESQGKSKENQGKSMENQGKSMGKPRKIDGKPRKRDRATPPLKSTVTCTRSLKRHALGAGCVF